jgi:hypothetical protein
MNGLPPQFPSSAAAAVQPSNPFIQTAPNQSISNDFLSVEPNIGLANFFDSSNHASDLHAAHPHFNNPFYPSSNQIPNIFEIPNSNPQPIFGPGNPSPSI